MQKIFRIVLGGAGLSLLTCGAIALQVAGAASMSNMSSPADKAFSSGMQNMQQGMASATITGNPDNDFVAMMLPHHKGAVSMAKVELQYGKDPMLRKMAEDIISSQEKEITQMKEWQRTHMASH